MSDSRRSKRNGDNEIPSTRKRSDSIPSSSSKRKSSKKSDPNYEDGFNPTSTNVSSTSQSPYPRMTAPSVASSYATANTTNPSNLPYTSSNLITNDSVPDQRAMPTNEAGRQSRKKRDSESRRDRSSETDKTESSRRAKRSDRDESRRTSRKEEKLKRTDSERALDNHRASMVENQFPGEFPSTFAEPYRPPGLAADYYGDHGESVASQPGVRPVPPSIIIAADQAHLHEATIEAAPPPEPSSLGQVGAAASFYGGTSDFESDVPVKPSKNGKRPSLKSARQSKDTASPRSSPGSEERAGPVPYSATGVGPAVAAGAGVGAASGVGEAAEYFSTQFRPDLTEGGSNTAASGFLANSGVQRPTQGMQNPVSGGIRPPVPDQRPSSGSNVPFYGATAAGIAAAGAGAYYAGHHTTEEHHAMDDAAAASYGGHISGQAPSNPQSYPLQPSTQQRRRRKGPFSKIVDFFQDRSAVAEYEAYTEAIGVCKYCFEPGSSLRDAPRKHHYGRRYSGERYGSSTRVDKLSRYQSSGDEKRRRSNGKKWVATGLAGYGLAKMSEAANNRRNDFDDTYSVKSGRPEGSTRVSFAADERVSRSHRAKRSSGDDQASFRNDSTRDNVVKIRKDRKTGELYEERPSRRRRDSSPSERFSKGAVISAGVAGAALATATGRRSRSNSPKKRYYSKRVSPNHSFIDLSATNSGGLGFTSFFNSPSANQRKGKKPKGLGFFNFTNASSSSSDADLAFGAGSVRRKKGRRADRKSRDDGNVNAEILGLAATGVALAAEVDREDRNPKQRADLLVVKEARNDRSRRHEKRRLQSPTSESDKGNDDWTDASDDESSVDSALAYGGRLSARPSRESLASNDGTDKWAWRWNNGKKPRRKPSQDLSRYESAGAGLAGAAVGEAATSASRYRPTESIASLPSMQQLDPVPMSNTNAVGFDRKTSTVSPTADIVPPVLSANTNMAPLEHPQPFVPISQSVYSRQASYPAPVYSTGVPPLSSQHSPHPPQAPMTESPKQMPVKFETQRQRPDEKRRRRQNSSPTPSQIRDDGFEDKSRRRTSAQESIKFDLTEEQTERDQHVQAGNRRRSRRNDHQEEEHGDGSNFQEEVSLERERNDISSSRRSSTDARTAREIEIEKELERLYEEDRRQKEARKSKRADTWPAAVGVGAGVAGVAAIAVAQSTSGENDVGVDRGERQSRRKSALKRTTTSPAVNDGRADSQQRRIARMAAARVKSTSSPVHEDYASYFVPPELAENVKEHNFAAEHRDDPVEESAQIVEVAPRTARRKDTFDPFVYRPFGIEPEDDPRRHPWPVPLLDIIEPTPPVSVRGDMSPLPTKSPEPHDVPEIPEVAPGKKQKRSSSVTWGEHRTHEYEVITPLEDHDEFVRTATYESSQPAIDLAERTHTDVKEELSEPVTVSVRTNSVSSTTAKGDVPTWADVVEEPQPKANYGQDIEFAAVLAAAAENAGFDPSIVVNDPTYHRRDSPPGSEDTSLYQSPFAETVSDLGTFHDYSVPVQKGIVKGEILPTPAEKVSQEELAAEHSKNSEPSSKDEQLDVEPKIPGGFDVFDYLDEPPTGTANSENNKSITEPIAVNISEDEKHQNKSNRSSEIYTESFKSRPIQWESGEKLKRSSSLDEINFEASFDRPGAQISYTSDPEGFEESERSKKTSSESRDRAMEAVTVGTTADGVSIVDEFSDRDRRRKNLEREDDYYDRVPPVSASDPGADTSIDYKKSRRRSKRESDIWDETKSVASSPAERRGDREIGKKSKKKSKRNSDVYDDDKMSVSSLPADLNGSKMSPQMNQDKKSGGFFGFFSSSKSETSSSPKRLSREMDYQSRNGRDTKSEDLDEPKRKSKKKSAEKDPDDTSSDLQRNRSDSNLSTQDDVKQHTPEDEPMLSEDVVGDNERTKDGMSFLGERPEMPPVFDGASGSILEAKLQAEQDISAQLPTEAPDPVLSISRSRSISPRTKNATPGNSEVTSDESTSPSAQRDHFRQRQLAEIRTSDVFPGSQATSSPTAVPLYFRRLPISPSSARSASVGSPSTGAHMSPLVTPRTRQGRPTSTEFRNSKEFRPLYLVERHGNTKQPEPDVEETYPSLPSSRTSSAHPSMENLRGDDGDESFAEQQMNLSHIRNRRHSFSYWGDERPKSPDYLDSGTATPTATAFPKELKREKPKYEFHSPSELLEDPSRPLVDSQEHQSPSLSPLVLPSVGSPASSVAKNDYAIRASVPPSPAREQHSVDDKDLETGIGLGLTGSAAEVLVEPQLIGLKETIVVTPEELPLPIAASATRFTENDAPIDQPIFHEIELPSAAQTVDDEFALQPVSSKKLKKDKKKNRKILNLVDESVETSSSLLDARDESKNVDSLAAGSAAEKLPASEVEVHNLLPEITVPSVSKLPEAALEVFETQGAAPAKDLDSSATTHVNEQALPQQSTENAIPVVVDVIKDGAARDEVPYEIATNENSKDEEKGTEHSVSTSLSQENEPELVASAVKNSDPSSQNMSIDHPFILHEDVTTTGTSSLPEEKINAQVSSDKVSVPVTEHSQPDQTLPSDSAIGVLDDTDRIEGIDGKALRSSYLFDKRIDTYAVGGAMVSPPSALEKAFANAETARGIAPEVSEEEALQTFRARVAPEPSLSQGRLDTIVEDSREGSKADLAQADEAVENADKDSGMPSMSKSKKSKKKDKRAKKSRDVEAFVAEPEDVTRDDTGVLKPEEVDITRGPVAAVEPMKNVTLSEPSIKPSGDDLIPHQEHNIDNEPVNSAFELDKAAVTQLEDASAVATPMNSTLEAGSAEKDLDEPIEGNSGAQTSKKDKKKGKQGRTTTLISDASTPVTEMSSAESIDQPKERQLDVDSFAMSTKKGKKSKKNGQTPNWTVGNTTPKQEEAVEQAEEPPEKVVEIEQDSATQAVVGDVPTLGAQKAKKNKKRSQILDWTDEAVTSQADGSVDTPAESQRETPTAQTEIEDSAWPTIRKGKKDKKKAKKLELLDVAPPKTNVVSEVEPVSIPVDVGEQIPAVDDASQLSVPSVPDEAVIPQPDPMMSETLHEASLPRDEVSTGRSVSPVLEDKKDGATLGQPELPSSEPAEISQMPPSELHESQLPEPTESNQLPAPELHGPQLPESAESSHLSAPELRAPQLSEPVGAIQLSAAKPHDQEMLETAIAKETSKLEDLNMVSDSREVPPRASEPEKAIMLSSGPSDDRDGYIVQDSHELPEPSKGLQQAAGVDEDFATPTLRDSRWASVFGELKERKVPELEEVPPPVTAVNEVQQAPTSRNPAWTSVFGQLKGRKVPESVEVPRQIAKVPESVEIPRQLIEVDKVQQVPTSPNPAWTSVFGQLKNWIVPGSVSVPESIEVPRQVDKVGEVQQSSVSQSPGWVSVFDELRQRKVPESREIPQQVSEVNEGPPAPTSRNPVWASVFSELERRKVSKSAMGDRQIVPAPDVEQERHVSAPAEATQEIDVRGEMVETITANDSELKHDQLHPPTQGPLSEQMLESQIGPSPNHNQTNEQAQHPAFEESASQIIPHTVRLDQDSHDQTQEGARHTAVEKPASHPAFLPVVEAQETHDQMQEEAHNTAIEESAALQPVPETQETRDQVQGDIQHTVLKEPASPAAFQTVVETQETQKQMQEEAQHVAIEEPTRHIGFQPVPEAQENHEQMPEKGHPVPNAEPEDHAFSQPADDTQDMHDTTHDEVQRPAMEEPTSATLSEPIEVVRDTLDRTHEHTVHESAMEISSQSEPQRQEASVSGNRDISDHLQSESYEPVPSEAIIHLKQPEEAETPTDSSRALTPLVEEQGDQFSWAPSKKGKKDKKKSKSKQSAFGEMPDSSSVSSPGKDVLPTNTPAGAGIESEIETPPVATPTEDAGPETDGLLRAGTKKSKKDKKKKKNLALANETPTLVGDDHGEPWSSIPRPASLASEETMEKATSNETQVAQDVQAEDGIQSQMGTLSGLPEQVGHPSMDSETRGQGKATIVEHEQVQEHTERSAARPTEHENLAVEPTSVHEEPAAILEEPAIMQEKPAIAQDEPIISQGEPAVMQDEAAAILEEPAVTQEEPIILQNEPAVILEGPPTISETAAILSEPAAILEEPAVIPETPATISEMPGALPEEPAVRQGTPAIVQEEPVMSQKEPDVVQEEPAVIQEEQATKLEEPAIPQEEQPTVQEDLAALQKEPSGQSWADTPKKKGKKEKKKRGSALATSGSATPQTEDEPQVAEGIVGSVVTPKVEIIEEDETALSNKKSKKDKKRKKAILGSLEDTTEPKSEEDTQTTGDASKGAETEITQDTTERTKADVFVPAIPEQELGEQMILSPTQQLPQAKDHEGALERETIVDIPRLGPGADQLEEQPVVMKGTSLVEESISEHKPVAATEEESIREPVLNQHKDDKDVSEEVKTIVVPENSLEYTSSPEPAGDSRETETVRDQDHTVVADSSLADEADRIVKAEITTETTAAEEPKGNAEQETSVGEIVDEPWQPILSSIDTPEVAPEGNAGAFTTKRNKKEKKTKRKSAVGSEEPTLGTIGPTAAAAADYPQVDTEQIQARDLVSGETQEAKKVPMQSSEPLDPSDSAQDMTPAAEPEEDTWGFPTKKTQKDKKKRQSTAREYSSTPSAPGTPSEPIRLNSDVVIPVNERKLAVTGEKHEDLEVEERALTAGSVPFAQVVKDDVEITGKKKSKKDKKKKRALLSWNDENDTSTDQPTETSTPLNEPEPVILREQETFMENTEEPTSMTDVKNADSSSPQVFESAVRQEHSLPDLQDHFNAIQPTAVEPSSDARDLTSGENHMGAKDDQQLERDFSTAKKSKKLKKGKKSGVNPTFAPAENGREELDSREDGQSRSVWVPEAPEAVAESGGQSLQTPEDSTIEEERSAPPMFQEAGMTTKAMSEQALPEGANHSDQPEKIGLGIAPIVSGASQAIIDQTLPVDDERMSQHESQHHAAYDQTIHGHEKQHERALLDSGQKPDILPILEASEIRPPQPTWSFANVEENTVQGHFNRDSGIQIYDSLPVQAEQVQPTHRDSGYVHSPIAAASHETAAHEEQAQNALRRPPRPISPTSSAEDLRHKARDRSPEPRQTTSTHEMDDLSLLLPGPHVFHDDHSGVLSKAHPSPVDSTTKDRSSALFNSSPSNRTEGYGVTPRLDTRYMVTPVTDLHRSPSIHGHRSSGDLQSPTPSRSPIRHIRHTSDVPITEPTQEVSQQPHRSIFGPFPTSDEQDRGLSPPRTPLQTIHEHVTDTSPPNRRQRPLSDIGSPDRGHKSVQISGDPFVGELGHQPAGEHLSNVSHTQTIPEQLHAIESEQESDSIVAGNHDRVLAEVGGAATVAGATFAAEELRPTSRDDNLLDTKSLGRSKSRSTSSKQLRYSQTSLENVASSSTHDPVREKGKAAARDMADVYNGYGEFPGAPMSPTRPASVRSRRSMQQLKDLESRLEQLASENRLLATDKVNAERQLQDLHFAQSRTEHASQEALELRDAELREKDEAIDKMREALDMLQKEVARLTEVNAGLMATHDELRSTHEQRYSQLVEQHAETHEQWQESSRELEDLRSKHVELSTGMEEIVRRELDTRLVEKDAEIQRLHDELEDVKRQVRELQEQILVGQSDEIIITRDEDYFDNACQQLCQHVQQWVLRFSKFSDTRMCRLTHEVRDQMVIDRFENAILDDSEVDIYLRDRVKRRDVFMSVVMTMIWEYIFTRYLFGMDREQRQKLKLLEKNLSEVGPQSAVHRWRAMTLTLLSKRLSFKAQRASDTEAVVQEIYSTLARFLPPLQHLQGQIQESLRNVMKAAVDLSIEMRTQRAEYIMLPPLQPEYDTNGNLARKVYFNAALMNERSGETTSNDELEAQQAVVRMVLFPLVVKKGNDTGEGDEEIVVCPAQVLVARSGRDKRISKAVSGDRMSIEQANRSVQSFAPSILDPTNVI